MKQPVSLVSRLWRWCDLGLAVAAAAAWYLYPRLGPVPLGLLALGLAGRLIFTRRLIRATPLDAPLALFLLTALAAALVAYNTGPQWFEQATPLFHAGGKFHYLVAAVGLYYAVSNLEGIDQVWLALGGFALLGAAVAVYFLLSNDWSKAKFEFGASLAEAIAQFAPRLEGRQLQPNVAGGLTAMLFPFYLPLLQDSLRARRWPWVALWLTGALITLIGLFLSSSRGAWVGLAAALAGWALLAVEATLRRRRVPFAPVAAGASALLLLTALGLRFVLSQTGSPGGVLAGAPDSLSRLDLLAGSWIVAQDYLFTGAGLGAFPMTFSTYYLLIDHIYLPHSHNVWMNVLFEQGLLGLIAFVWLITAFAAPAVRALQLLTRAAAPAPTRDTGNKGERTSLRGGPLPLQADEAFSSSLTPTSELLRRPYGAPAQKDGSVKGAARRGIQLNAPTKGRVLLPWRISPRTWGSGNVRPSQDSPLTQVEHARGILAACLASMAVLLVHGLVDDVPYGSRGLILFLAAPGLAAAVQARLTLPRTSQLLERLAIPLVVVGLALLAWAFFARDTLLSAWYANLGALAQARVELAQWPQTPVGEARRKGDLSSAESLYNQSLAYDQSNAVVHRRLGLIRLDRFQFAEAVSELEAARQGAPDHRAALKALGLAYTWLGRYDEAYPLLLRIPEARYEMRVASWWWGTRGRPDLAERASRMAERLPASTGTFQP